MCYILLLITALKAKCLKALDILKVLSSSNWGGDRTVLLNLYRSLIRSKLDYGSIVYGSARKSYLKSLDTIHHQGLRLALGAFRTSPIESLYAESNEPSLYKRREKLSLQYVTKLAANPRNSAYDCVFNPKYERFYNNKPLAWVAPLDAPSDWRPGGRGFNPRRGRQHSFVEIDREIFSTVILSLPMIQEGQLSVSGERICTILVNRLED